MPLPASQADLRSRLADSRDRRVQRTRSQLVHAYGVLLEERATITASAVVERAGVTRSSFYAHFGGVDELAVVALAEYLRGLVEPAREAVNAGRPRREVNQGVFRELARFLDAHRDTYGALLVEGGAFAQFLVASMVELNLGTLRTRDLLHGDLDVTAQFFAGGVVAVLVWWLQAGPDAMSPEALALALIDVTPRDFSG